jgi:extradiol dioxygenase family protein
MDRQTPEGYMQNSSGHLVPVEHVSDYDKLKDQTVVKIIDSAIFMQKQLREFKTAVMADIYAMIEIAHEKYQAKHGGKKGNISLTSFDGHLKVVLNVSEFMTFDERLTVAKSLVDECLKEWTEGARPEIQTIVNAAFEVDNKGNISTTKVLSLLKLEFSDEKWKRAMKAIKESLTVQHSKKYVRFYRRIGLEDKWEAIPLDIAAL